MPSGPIELCSRRQENAPGFEVLLHRLGLLTGTRGDIAVRALSRVAVDYFFRRFLGRFTALTIPRPVIPGVLDEASEFFAIPLLFPGKKTVYALS